MNSSKLGARPFNSGEVYAFQRSQLDTKRKVRGNATGSPGRDSTLSNLQLTAIRLLAEGCGVAETSRQLEISTYAVDLVIKTCRAKLRAKDNFHLIARAYQDKILT